MKGLPYYNELLLKAYTNRDIIGVSLKKTSRANFSQQNWKKPFKEPKFTKTTLGKRDFFKSKDGYLFWTEGEIQFRTFPAFQGEIIGKSAKHGKISGDSGPSGPIKFTKKFKGKNSGYLESKYLVTLMFNELKGREQMFLSLAYRYAKSISATSSVHLKVY